MAATAVSQYYLSFHSIPEDGGTWRRSRRRAGSSVCCTPPVPSIPSSSPPPVVGPELSLSFGAHVIPHPKKVEKGGEDAFFVSSYNGGVVAVADGVSGWAEQNVNPALFSRELMAKASSLVEDEEVSYNPRTLIQKAHAATSSVGSATVIIAMLEKNGTLKIASVGDCGLRVIRKGQVVFSTSPQEHYFDCPYQLSSEAVGQTYLDATLLEAKDPRVLEELLSFVKHNLVVSSVELVKGDTLVIGSDGLFDNAFDHEIVSAVGTSSDDVDNTAKVLANLAHRHSLDLSYESPYSLEARARGFDVPWWKKILGMKLTGGKLDDITVIVGHAEIIPLDI